MPNTAYRDYLQSPAWKHLAARVRARDTHTCQDCGARNIPLHVHHLTYANIFREPLADLITVCDNCHRTRHGLRTQHTQLPAQQRRSSQRRRIWIVVRWATIALIIYGIILLVASQKA